MGDPNVVEMAIIKPHKVMMPVRESLDVRFTGNKFSVWLQTKAWEFLNNRGAVVEDIEYRRVVFKKDDFAQYLDKNWELLAYINNERTSQVLMGGDEFQEFLYETRQGFQGAGQSSVVFDTRVREGSSDRYGTSMAWRNIPVRVVPHMKGVLFL